MLLMGILRLGTHWFARIETHRLFSLTRGRLWLWAAVAIFVVAAAVRLPFIDDPYFSLQPVREYRSAIIARAFYFQKASDIEEWEKEIASLSREREWVLEPPVMEWLAAQVYQIAGGERVWAPRLLATGFWLASAAFLYLIISELAGELAAFWGAVYYLFVPLGMRASLSFMPDPLMIMLFTASLWAVVRYDRNPSWKRLIIAAVATGACLLVKPLCLFVLLGGFVALKVARHGPRGLMHLHNIAFLVAAVIPMAIYYGYGLLVAGFLQGQADMSFMPHLLRTKIFWQNWFFMAGNEVEFGPMVGALAGYSLLPKGRMRFLLTGLFGGYILFGLIFTYHIHTHGYYQLQLVAIVALALSPILANVFQGLMRRGIDLWSGIAMGAIVLIVMVLTVRDFRSWPALTVFETRAVAEEIGAIVNHSPQVVYIAKFYGRPLEYHGQFSGTFWPRPDNSGVYNPDGPGRETIRGRLEALPFEPHFFVITNMAEFQQDHADLRAYLETACQLVAKAPEYLIYTDCDLSFSDEDL
jgi:hypothetical protein